MYVLYVLYIDVPFVHYVPYVQRYVTLLTIPRYMVLSALS